MVAVIILLYIVATINFVLNWLYIHSIFVEHGQSFRTRYLAQCIPASNQQLRWVSRVSFVLSLRTPPLYV